MRDILAVGGGTLVVIATLVDMIRTVLTVSAGHGTVSYWMSRTVTHLLARASTLRPFRRVLTGRGPLVFVTVTLGWAAAFLLGWSLIFSPDGALTASSPGTELGWMDRVDFATTLVLGASTTAAQPTEQPWSLIASVGSFNGVALISFGLAYALPVVASVIRLRTLARTIDGLGRGVEELVAASSRDGEAGMTDLVLLSIRGQLVQVTQEIHAYPIVPHFYSARRESAVAPALDGLARMLERRDELHGHLPESLARPLEKALDDLLEVVLAYFLHIEVGFDRAADPAAWRREVIDAWAAVDGWTDELEGAD